LTIDWCCLRRLGLNGCWLHAPDGFNGKKLRCLIADNPIVEFWVKFEHPSFVRLSDAVGKPILSDPKKLLGVGERVLPFLAFEIQFFYALFQLFDPFDLV
jgi:hypothetical protein